MKTYFFILFILCSGLVVADPPSIPVAFAGTTYIEDKPYSTGLYFVGDDFEIAAESDTSGRYSVMLPTCGELKSNCVSIGDTVSVRIKEEIVDDILVQEYGVNLLDIFVNEDYKIISTIGEERQESAQSAPPEIETVNIPEDIPKNQSESIIIEESKDTEATPEPVVFEDTVADPGVKITENNHEIDKGSNKFPLIGIIILTLIMLTIIIYVISKKKR